MDEKRPDPYVCGGCGERKVVPGLARSCEAKHPWFKPDPKVLD